MNGNFLMNAVECYWQFVKEQTYESIAETELSWYFWNEQLSWIEVAQSCLRTKLMHFIRYRRYRETRVPVEKANWKAGW
jgi:hypothetical protein